MKLKSCYIENYGKIKKTDFDFNDGLTAFCENNGYGKSTLASFIKAMFYGLEPYRSNTKDFCERQHFYPFDGGKFGGNLTFEADGKTYKIERFFGEKSDTQDECCVYSGGKRTDVFGADIGKAIFGIDAKSFERTIFIGSDEIEISSTTGINAKLNNFLDGGDDKGLDNALAALEKVKKEYKKSRTGNDLISAKRREIDELNSSITNAENVRAALGAKYEKHSALRKKISDCDKRLEKAQTLNVILKDWERYDGYIQETAEDGAKIKAIESGYPFGVPTADEAEKVTLAIQREAQFKAQLSQRTFDDADESRLINLGAHFSGGVPTAEMLEGAERDINDVASLEAEIKLAENRTYTERESKLCRTFAAGCPDADEFDAVRKKVEKFKAADAELSLLPAGAPAGGSVKTSKLFLVFAIISALVIAGGACLFIVSVIAGAITLGAGAATLLADGFLYLNKKSQKAAIQSESPERRKLSAEAAALSDGIKAFLLPYGYNSGYGVVFDFADMEKDCKEYCALKSEQEKSGEKLGQMREKMIKTQTALKTFFEKYGYSGSFMGNLSALRSDLAEYENLKGRKVKSAANSGEIEDKINENAQPLYAFCKKYRMDADAVRAKIRVIADDINTLATLQERVEQNKARAEKLKKEQNLCERPEGGACDIEGLNANLAALREEESRLFREICDDESQVEKLDGFLADRQAAEQSLDEYGKKHELLSLTIDCLKQAEENLKDKYVKPVLDKYKDYSELLEKTLGEKITMNRDFEISFERSGKERSEKHLSTGQRSICAFCFRLALIWNMYESEKPFLILDDPFLSLDDEHFKKVKTMLSDLSKKMQLVYFSCHSSRAL